jgi:hypothetical protein
MHFRIGYELRIRFDNLLRGIRDSFRQGNGAPMPARDEARLQFALAGVTDPYKPVMNEDKAICLELRKNVGIKRHAVKLERKVG